MNWARRRSLRRRPPRMTPRRLKGGWWDISTVRRPPGSAVCRRATRVRCRVGVGDAVGGRAVPHPGGLGALAKGVEIVVAGVGGDELPMGVAQAEKTRGLAEAVEQPVIGFAPRIHVVVSAQREDPGGAIRKNRPHVVVEGSRLAGVARIIDVAEMDHHVGLQRRHGPEQRLRPRLARPPIADQRHPGGSGRMIGGG